MSPTRWCAAFWKQEPWLRLEIRPRGTSRKAVKDVSAGKLFLTPKVSDMVLNGFLKFR